MQAIKDAMARFHKETDGLFAFVVLPIILIFAWLALLPIVPLPVVIVMLELGAPIVLLVLDLVLSD